MNLILLIVYIVSTIFTVAFAFRIGVRRGHAIAKEIFEKANDEIRQIYLEDKSKLVEKHNSLLETLKMTVKTKNGLLNIKENEILRQDAIIQELKADIERMQSLDFSGRYTKKSEKPDLTSRVCKNAKDLDVERKEIIELIQQPKLNEVSGD